MHSQLSVRGRAMLVLDSPLRYRAAADSYQAIVLELDRSDVVYAMDWFTENPDAAGRALHTLTVPGPVMLDLGLDRVEGFDAVLDALDATGRSVHSTTTRDYPTSMDPVAVALGLPPAAILQYESQLLKDAHHRPLALEVAYSEWLG